MAIPKLLSHIWVGPRPAPTEWMRTWREMHPDWGYRLWGNEDLRSRRWRNRHLIDEYLKRREYPGVADLMRYEILLETGGFMPGADSIAVARVDELFTEDAAYTVYENEFTRGQLVSPILACEPGNPFVARLVEELHRLRPEDLDRAWKSTGNLFVAEMIERHEPDNVRILPSHTFIPEHFTGRRYEGPGKVYGRQLFGETTRAYDRPSLGDRIAMEWGKLRGSVMRRRLARRQNRRP